MQTASEELCEKIFVHFEGLRPAGEEPEGLSPLDEPEEERKGSEGQEEEREDLSPVGGVEEEREDSSDSSTIHEMERRARKTAKRAQREALVQKRRRVSHCMRNVRESRQELESFLDNDEDEEEDVWPADEELWNGVVSCASISHPVRMRLLGLVRKRKGEALWCRVVSKAMSRHMGLMTPCLDEMDVDRPLLLDVMRQVLRGAKKKLRGTEETALICLMERVVELSKSDVTGVLSSLSSVDNLRSISLALQVTTLLARHLPVLWPERVDVYTKSLELCTDPSVTATLMLERSEILLRRGRQADARFMEGIRDAIGTQYDKSVELLREAVVNESRLWVPSAHLAVDLIGKEDWSEGGASTKGKALLEWVASKCDDARSLGLIFAAVCTGAGGLWTNPRGGKGKSSLSLLTTVRVIATMVRQADVLPDEVVKLMMTSIMQIKLRRPPAGVVNYTLWDEALEALETLARLAGDGEVETFCGEQRAELEWSRLQSRMNRLLEKALGLIRPSTQDVRDSLMVLETMAVRDGDAWENRLPFASACLTMLRMVPRQSSLFVLTELIRIVDKAAESREERRRQGKEVGTLPLGISMRLIKVVVDMLLEETDRSSREYLLAVELHATVLSVWNPTDMDLALDAVIEVPRMPCWSSALDDDVERIKSKQRKWAPERVV